MVSAAQTSYVHQYFVKFTEWAQEHPREALITTVACAALGIVCTLVIAKVIFVTAASIVLTIVTRAGFSICAALILAYYAQKKSSPAAIPQAQMLKAPAPKKRIDVAVPQAQVLKAPAPKKNIDLVAVMQQTLKNLKNGYYSRAGDKIALPRMSKGFHYTYFMNGGRKEQRVVHKHSRLYSPEISNTVITVVRKDCLYVAQELREEGLHPLVLDMANSVHPGGNYLEGARSQEEDICRRSNLSIAIDPVHGLESNFYPINTEDTPYAGLLVKSVHVFRAGEDRQYEYLEKPFDVDVAVVAAPCRPPLDSINGRLRINDADALILRERIRTTLHMAYNSGNNALVLGAFGCGAFANPPEHVAGIFKQVIQEEFANCFDKIVFAIVKDGNDGKVHNREGNYLPFKRQFPD